MYRRWLLDLVTLVRTDDHDCTDQRRPVADVNQITAVQLSIAYLRSTVTRKPSCRWQTRTTRKPAKNCSNSTCLQRCRWQYWLIFFRLAVVASEICETPRNSLKIQTQGHRSWCQCKAHMW